MSTFEKLRFLKEHGVSMSYIARETSCSPQVICNWLRGKAKISERMEAAISQTIESFIQDIQKIY